MSIFPTDPNEPTNHANAITPPIFDTEAATMLDSSEEATPEVAEDEDPIHALIAAQPQGEVRPDWVSEAIENRPPTEPSPGACNPGEPNNPLPPPVEEDDAAE